jgi:predicted AlkP superfamily pyrophosphatase or phosphodiesterase
VRFRIRRFVTGALLALMCSVAVKVEAASSKHRPVLMISIDGLRPDYVTQASKHGLKIPVLRSLMAEGTYADGVVNVSPTITYPNHTTLVTGVWPDKHGIYNNLVFDPLGKEKGAWNWYAAEVKVPTLWQAAKESGLVTASIFWPVTVHSPFIDYDVPEYWRTKTEEDHFVMEAVSSPPGFLERIEKRTGPFYAGKGDIELDRRITKTSIEIIQAKHPDFMTIHIVSVDHAEHEYGPFSAEADADLEQVDGLIGKLMRSERQVHPDADILIVSDHGFLPVSHAVNLNAALVKAGLIAISEKPIAKVRSWKAFSWNAGGTAVIVLQDPDDKATEERVGQLLAQLAKVPANGINRVLSHKQALATGSTATAAFLVDFKSGYYAGNKLTAPIVENDPPLRGDHGYLSSHSELHSSFFIVGPDIVGGKDLGTIDMRQIAPTVARELGVSLPSANVPPLNVHATE